MSGPPPTPGCPTAATLARLLAGNLAEPRAEEVRQHLHDCSRCRATLDRETDDPTLRQWLPRGPLPAAAVPREAALDRVLEQCRRSPLDPSNDRTVPALPGGDMAFLDPPRQPGDLGTLGSYRVLAQLGRGGMGIVFRAYDETLRRTVAIKVLPTQQIDDQARARLVREAQLTAGFRHDHVVTVHAVVNPPNGLPYLVMEYLAGPTLAALVRSRQRLEPREAASILVQVADGLAAAHAAGLVHRDVKPGNILFDPETGRAKVTDFSVARDLAQSSSLTTEGTVVGTPAYMSPEQARGALPDARGDVYSLGVTLYETLTGEVPFRGAPHLVLRQVLEEEPRPPRRLNDAVPPDLETICLKAMAKEPAHRYQSARDFADDLRRFLAGEPIQARPTGHLGRMWRWGCRNRRVTLLSAAVFTLLLLLALGSSVAALWIHRAWDRAERQRQVADEARRVADQEATKAETARLQADASARAAREHFTIALDGLNTLIGQAQEQLSNKPGTLRLRRQLAETALEGLEKIAHSAEKTPDIDRSMVLAHNRLSDLFYQLGHSAEARSQAEQACVLAEALLAANPDNAQAQDDLAVASEKRGNVARYSGDHATAGASYRRLLQLRRNLAEAHPDDPELSCGLAAALNHVGAWQLDEGEPAAAHASFRQALHLLQSPTGTAAPEKRRTRALSQAWDGLGAACENLFAYPAAERYYRQALELDEACTARAPEDRQIHLYVGYGWSRLGWLNFVWGRYEAAEEAYGKALVVGEALAADGEDATAQKAVVGWYARLGDVQRCRGRMTEARATFRKGLALAESLARRDEGCLPRLRDLERLRCGLAELDEREGHYRQAAEQIERVLAFCCESEEKGPALEALVQDLEVRRAAYLAAGKEGQDSATDLPSAVRAALLRLHALELARQGRPREATALAEEYRQLAPEDAEVLIVVARVHVLGVEAGHLGPAAGRAVEALQAAIRLKPYTARTVRTVPDLVPLAGYPPFEALVPPGKEPSSAEEESH